MGCVLSYFRHGTLTLPEATLTDKLLEGEVTEERQTESAGEKKGAAAASQRSGDTQAAGGDHIQDDASHELADDDKALLLGALGATAAGAITVGAVAGALKTAHSQGELENTQQDPSEPLTTAPDQSESLTSTPGTVAPDTSDEPPVDGGAGAAAAAIVGTGGAVTVAALTGAALHSDDESTSAAATSDLPQRSSSETERRRNESTSDGKDEPTDPGTEQVQDEARQTFSPEAERKDDAAISSPENSEVSKLTEDARSPAGSADVPSVEDRDQTPLQSEPAVVASPDDSVFDDKQQQSQPESPRERQLSPAVAENIDSETSENETGPATRPHTSSLGRESPSARLTQPSGAGTYSDKEDVLSHSSTPVAESPRPIATEQDDFTTPITGNEPIAPPATDTDDISNMSPVKESSAELSKIGDQVKEAVISSASIKESLAPSEIVKEGSRVHSSTSVDDKDTPAVVAGDEHHVQSPAKDESLIQPTVVEEQFAVQTSATDDDSYIPANTPMEESGDQSNHSNVDSVAPSSHGEKEDQPTTSEASVDTAQQEPPTEDHNRVEVDTPKIVPAKRLSHSTPEYEKFMSILVSPKGGRQPSVERADIEASTKQTESNEQRQSPSESAIDSETKSEGLSRANQKHEDEIESRAESSADAVYGSATDLQQKIDSVQSPVPSVKEEAIVKVDRFSVGSNAGSTSVGSAKESASDDVNTGVFSSPSGIKDDTNNGGSQLDPGPALTDMNRSGNISQHKPESDAGSAEVSVSRDVQSDAGPSEDALEQDPSSGVVADKNEFNPPTSAEPAEEETDMAHDVSERTEDYDFDPLARTQSFVFPDDLAGRSSQLSEKPSSPFPELDESDIRDASATLSPAEVEQAMEDEGKVTSEGNVSVPETDMSALEANMTVPETEKTTPLKDETAPEGVLSTQQTEQVDAEYTSPETTKKSSQSSVVEETDDLQKNPNQTEQPPPEIDQAATKIQAGVRGWQTRRKISRQQEAATQIQAGFRGWRVRHGRRMRRTSSLPVLSKDEPSATNDQYMDVDTLKDRAAAKIQAGFRGWRSRQEMKSLAAVSPMEDVPRVSPAISMAEINAEEQAAVRIQAGYRGWKTRHTLKRSLSDPNSEALVLAEGQQRKRVAETGAGVSGPQPGDVDERLTSTFEATTPRDEDETAHSIQSIQSEIASSGSTPRQEHNAPTVTPPANEPFSATQLVGDPFPDPPQADPSSVDHSTASLISSDENQQAEAAAKIQAGFRGWKTRQQMRTDPTAVRPTVSAKSVTDSGALPIDFAIVHRPEDDWLTQDLLKIEAEKRALGVETGPGADTAEKLVASASDEPDGKEGKDARPDSTSTTESSSSWLTHAQTEIRASFQGLRDNVSDALKTVEDTARLVEEKGSAAGAEGRAEDGAVVVAEDSRKVAESGAGTSEPAQEGPQGASTQAKAALSPLKPDAQAGMDGNDADKSEKSPSEREEEEIWEEIQRSMRHED